MRTASSASRTCGAPASASLYTATARTPSSRHARTMRSAISPRLAMSTLSNIGLRGGGEDGGEGRARELRAPDERVAQAPLRVDEERRRMRDVPRVEPDGMPDAVALDHGAVLIAAERERVAVLRAAQRVGHARARLREHHRDPDRGVLVTRPRVAQLPELPAAVRSPEATMEHEEETGAVVEESVQLHAQAAHRVLQREVRHDIAQAERAAGPRHQSGMLPCFLA